MRSSVVCATLALALSSLSPAPAQAEEELSPRAAFDNARKAMQAKRWAEAHSLFVELWERQRTYDVALHLGQVEYHLQRFREAATHLAFGLMLLPPREKPEIAERSQALLELCKQELGTLELKVRNKNATVLIDGVAVAEAPLVADTYVEPGRHHFEVRLEGHESEQWDAQFERGTTQQRLVELRPVTATATVSGAANPNPATPSPSAPEPSTPPHGAGSESGDWLPVIAGGVLTLVGVGAGIGFQLLRDTRSSQAEDLRDRIAEQEDSDNGCRDSKDPNTLELCRLLTERNSDYDSYGKFELASFVVAGGALAATTVYFFLARPDRARTPTESASASRLRITPTIARGFGGAQLSFRF